MRVLQDKNRSLLEMSQTWVSALGFLSLPFPSTRKMSQQLWEQQLFGINLNTTVKCSAIQVGQEIHKFRGANGRSASQTASAHYNTLKFITAFTKATLQTPS
jgi:hypothetical protein